ncbi:MAG: PPOX class F420-dependent oxidoreductase [Jiangellales bacterium]
MTDLDTLGAATYVSLTTFRRDGTPVATPVWVARDGDHLYVTTPVETGKVKRLRHTSRVLLASCDARGRLKGEHVDGTARLLDAAGSEHTLRLIDAKYGLISKVMGLLDVVVRNRGKKPERIGIEIALADA